MIQPFQGPKYNLSVYVHVGANSLREAQDMVDHAMALTYNKTTSHLKGDALISLQFWKFFKVNKAHFKPIFRVPGHEPKLLQAVHP